MVRSRIQESSNGTCVEAQTRHASATTLRGGGVVEATCKICTAPWHGEAHTSLIQCPSTIMPTQRYERDESGVQPYGTCFFCSICNAACS